MPIPKFILLMGVSGCGKSTAGPLLAEKLGGVYIEGDDLHPPANKEKMGAGIPLEDADRWPWYENIRNAVNVRLAKGESPLVVASSALKRSYRDFVFTGFAPGETRIVYMKGSHKLIAGRLSSRVHEYMPASLLDSQFAALEEPVADEKAVIVGIDAGTEGIVSGILEGLEAD
jgi:gluconokinase